MKGHIQVVQSETESWIKLSEVTGLCRGRPLWYLRLDKSLFSRVEEQSYSEILKSLFSLPQVWLAYLWS